MTPAAVPDRLGPLAAMVGRWRGVGRGRRGDARFECSEEPATLQCRR